MTAETSLVGGEMVKKIVGGRGWGGALVPVHSVSPDQNRVGASPSEPTFNHRHCVDI